MSPKKIPQKTIQQIHDSLTSFEIKLILRIVNSYGTEDSELDRVQLRRDLEYLVWSVKRGYEKPKLTPKEAVRKEIKSQIKKLLNKL
jgi:hypothetical protein